MPRTLIQHSRGTVARQTHRDLPGLKEDLLTREGFDGRNAVLYRRHDPTTSRTTGRFRTTEVLASDLRPSDLDEPTGSPVRLFHNQDVTVWLSRRATAMPWFRRNVDGDECWFVHQGSGRVDTEFGPLSYERGDYIVIPKAVTHRWLPAQGDSVLLGIETVGELTAPTYVGLGRHAPFDPDVLQIPTPQVLPDDQDEYEIRIKYDGTCESLFLDHNPCDVAGWKGDYFPFGFNIRDWNVVMSDSLHLPPSMHVFLTAPGVNIINLLPRPMETIRGVERLPFYHRNADYDEIALLHGGETLGRPLEKGLISHDPQGIHHGFPQRAREKAEREWEEHSRFNWEIVMVETYRPLIVDHAVSDAARSR